jgi:hypothetical protein
MIEANLRSRRDESNEYLKISRHFQEWCDDAGSVNGSRRDARLFRDLANGRIDGAFSAFPSSGDGPPLIRESAA